MTVLIVDDDEDVRDMLALCLATEGFETTTATDGGSALARLRRPPPISLVLVDLRMPRMNGLELLEATRGDASLASIPFVAMTGDTASAPRALAAGAAACLTKPLDYDEIVAVVREFAI